MMLHTRLDGNFANIASRAEGREANARDRVSLARARAHLANPICGANLRTPKLVQRATPEALEVSHGYPQEPQLSLDHARRDSDKMTRAMTITHRTRTRSLVDLRDDLGGPLLCDSCDAGAAKVPDRNDERALAWFVTENYKAKLSRPEDSPHGGKTCYGKDMQRKALEKLMSPATETSSTGG